MSQEKSLLQRARRSRELGIGFGAALVASLTFGLWPAGADGPEEWRNVPVSTAEDDDAFEPGVANVSDLSGIDYYEVAYRKVDGTVQLRGVVGPDVAAGGMRVVAGTSVLYGIEADIFAPGPSVVELFQLPCGFRPEKIVAMASIASDMFGKNIEPGGVYIMPSGEVYAATFTSPQNTSVGPTIQLTFILDNLRFDADQTTIGEECETPPTTTTEEVTTTTEEVTTTTAPEE